MSKIKPLFQAPDGTLHETRPACVRYVVCSAFTGFDSLPFSRFDGYGQQIVRKDDVTTWLYDNRVAIRAGLDQLEEQVVQAFAEEESGV